MYGLLLNFILLAGLVVNGEDYPKLTTPLGEIVGTTMTTRLGKTINAFRGIRYAEPPLNDLRFKPPRPLTEWDGVYNATEDGPECPQPSMGVPTSEDCLFLNVYTTELPNGKINPKKPVILYLHPGGYYSGTAHSAWHGPQYLADQDIVLVTTNYRLGTLGFLSTGKDAPGNNGLKDQVVVMKWVRDNIASFGGDPDSVTLFGYSVGAMSITLHLVSPMSRGLFHRAIIGSESNLGIYPQPINNQLDIAQKQARIVGCLEEPIELMMECLKRTPAEKLGSSLDEFAEFSVDPVLIWYPVIEGDYGQERFLTDHPIKLIQSGEFYKVPVIAGITHFEFTYRAYPPIKNSTLLSELNNNFNDIAPIICGYERNTTKSIEVSQEVRKFYFGESPISEASLTNLSELYADSITGFPVNRAVQLLAEKSTEPVYYYKFSYKGRYSHFYLPGTDNKPIGPVHHDDLIYLFYISKMFPYFNGTEPEVQMVEKLTTMWATFAKTGNPIPESTPELDNVVWETYNNDTQKYLDIGDKLVLKEKMFEERYNLWLRLFPNSDYEV